MFFFKGLVGCVCIINLLILDAKGINSSYYWLWVPEKNTLQWFISHVPCAHSRASIGMNTCIRRDINSMTKYRFGIIQAQATNQLCDKDTKNLSEPWVIHLSNERNDISSHCNYFFIKAWIYMQADSGVNLCLYLCSLCLSPTLFLPPSLFNSTKNVLFQRRNCVMWSSEYTQQSSEEYLLVSLLFYWSSHTQHLHVFFASADYHLRPMDAILFEMSPLHLPEWNPDRHGIRRMPVYIVECVRSKES